MKFVFLIPLVLGLSVDLASATTANYADFSSTTGLTLNGNAAQVGNVLRLVPNVATQSGTAFLTTAISLDAATAFSSSFKFNVTTDPGNPTDGFAFLLQNDPAGKSALGTGGQGSGYVGLKPSVAVLFRGRDPNLIGVITGGADGSTLSPAWQPANYYTGAQGSFYNQDEYAWIDYNPGSKQLSVFLSTSSTKPGAAIMSTSVDVFGTLGSQAYVGFSAGNGGATGNQDILNWSLNTAPVPEPTTSGMFALGLVALALARRRPSLKGNRQI